MDYNYNELRKNFKDARCLRQKLVKDALLFGVKKTARKWQTTPKTVRKWRDRLKKEGKVGLKDRSRRPKHSPRQMPARFRFKIGDATKKALRDNKRTNAALLKRREKIPFSQKTVRKEMKKSGYSPKTRKKTRRRKDLRAEKAKMRAFEKLQIDVKYLDDIPEFCRDWKRFRLPRYQITARDVKTGALFFAYALEKSSTNATLFLLELGEHLKKFGVDLSRVKVQTDNGTEFAMTRNSVKKSAFTKAVEQIWRSRHLTIPPASPTFNSDVETSHNLIEREFYAAEYFNSREDFFKKAADWQRFFNFERFNKSKNAAPMQILGAAFPSEVLQFEPKTVDFFWDLHKNDFAFISSA